MELGLEGSVAVIFGAARGIGAAIARAFAGESARVAAVDRDPLVLELAGQLSPTGLGLVADVTDYDAVRRTAGEVAARFGRCDHVVFAVGAGSGKFGFPFWKLEPTDWDRVLKVNLIGAVNVAHAFAPAMAEAAGEDEMAGAGRSMLLLSSVAGQIGSQTDPPYSAAKAAVINFAQCAAKDLAPYRRAGQRAVPRHGQDPAQPRGLRGLGPRAARVRAPLLRGMDGREDPEARPPEPMAGARGHRRHGRLPGVEPRAEHHRPDDQRRRRVCDALVRLAGSLGAPGVAMC